jgi:hypothetical protein
MLHNDNIENGMLKFWEKVEDEETGETWEREVPACHCSECNRAIYAEDNCYVFPKMYADVPYILCEDCIDSYAAYGREAAEALTKAAREARKAV